MPTTRRSTAAEAKKGATDNRSAQPTGKKAPGNTTTTSRASKRKPSEAVEERNLQSAEKSSGVVEPPLDLHSSNVADESPGILSNGSPIIVSKVSIIEITGLNNSGPH